MEVPAGRGKSRFGAKEREMRRTYPKRRTEEVTHTCGECSHLTPSGEYLSVKERRPILGVCPFSKFMRLLSERVCEHFRIKEQ